MCILYITVCEWWITLRKERTREHKKCIDQNWEHLVMWSSNLLLSSVFMRFYTLSVVICPPPPQLSPPPLQSKIPHPKSRESHCSGFSPENLGFPGSSGFSPENLGKPISWNLKSSFYPLSFFLSFSTSGSNAQSSMTLWMREGKRRGWESEGETRKI